ncbi:hypothetical protein FHL15_005172 [Xylaria flabelliformis]|uniref:Uncharacterized protein n=1 Tax=Xylaria flabelliformis TaxID=2512241 RepID=A0A553I0Q7_9PEZI|nr:hypothetical protein FHL15_005172 [Xylaria flabelliformis]
MSSSDDSEFEGPRPAAKQIEDDCKAFVRLFKTQASIMLPESTPPVTKKELRALTRDLKPSIDEHIIGGSSWTEHLVKKVESEYIVANSVINEGKPKPDGGLMLYRTCLRLWRRLPTQIITPANGLVFMGKGDGNFLHDPMKLRLKWSAIFNERLTSLLAHRAWSDKLHYLLMALAFASMCESDDRRYWGVIYVGKNAFCDTWESCQAEHPEKPKFAILDDVEKSLKAQGIWPCTICQVLQAIAKRARLRQAPDEDEVDENEEESDGENSVQRQSLRAISANHLLCIQSALDGMINAKGRPTFHKTKDYFNLFSASRDGDTYKFSDYPTSEGYPELLKQARAGLVYDAYAYKIAWEKENVVLSDTRKDVAGSSLNMTRPSPSQRGNASDADQGGLSQRRSHGSANSNNPIGRRKRPRDIIADIDASKQPKRAARHPHPALILRGASSTPVKESPVSLSHKSIPRSIIKTEEQRDTPVPAMARNNSMMPMASSISSGGSHLGLQRMGYRSEVAEYENVYSSRIDLIRRSDPEPRGTNEFKERGLMTPGYSHSMEPERK